jgi:hypothetical protein
MTTRLASAAETMARVLGMPGYKCAVVDHPSEECLAEYVRADGVFISPRDHQTLTWAAGTGAPSSISACAVLVQRPSRI